MKTLSLCLLVAQFALVFAMVVLAWKVWPYFRKNAPQDVPLPKSVTVCFRTFWICLAVATALGIVQAVLRFAISYS